MPRSFSLLSICLLGFGVFIEPPFVQAQVATPDSTSRFAVDSPAAQSDTTRSSSDTASSMGAAPDTTQRDTTAVRDTTGARDTTQAKDTTAGKDTASTRDSARRDTTSRSSSIPKQPADSILARACTG